MPPAAGSVGLLITPGALTQAASGKLQKGRGHSAVEKGTEYPVDA